MKDNIVVHKRFRNFVSVLYWLSYFFLAVFSIAGVALIGVGIAVPFIPIDLINSLLIEVPVEGTYESTGITIQITQELLESISISRMSLFLVLLAVLLIIINFTAIIFFINRWLKNLKNTDIFTIQNSKMIEYTAYSFIILAFVQGLAELSFQYFIYQSLNINELAVNVFANLPYSSYTYDYNLNIVTLFSGIFIWIIAKVFKYGAFLQDEYDATV